MYRGHTPVNAVRSIIAAKIYKTMLNTPEVTKRARSTAATPSIKRIILSMLPMLFFKEALRYYILKQLYMSGMWK